MHLPFIAHTSTCQMYVTITCMSLKHAPHLLDDGIDMCTGQWRFGTEYFEE